LQCVTNGQETRLSVTNQGIAPIYRDAYFAIKDNRSAVSLKGLLPQDTINITIPTGLVEQSDLHITSPHILSTQKIEFAAQLFE
jgi:hypothetical protein